MKRIKHCILMAAGLMAMAGCTHRFDQYNTNPNEMDLLSVSSESLLQELVFGSAEGLLYRTWLINGELIQYTVSGTGNNSYHRYVIGNSIMASAWSNLYTWATNADHVIQVAEQENNPATKAIAMTMKVLLVSNVTDIWGYAPYSDAFRVREGVIKPVYDDQKTIYQALFAELEEANELYAGATNLSNADRDFLYGGAIDKWQKFNNSLYLRLLMRVINRDSHFGASVRIREIVSNPAEYPVFTSNSDNAVVKYSGVTPFVNYFGSTTNSNFTTTGRKPAEQIIDMMAPVDDPRISVFFIQGGNSWKGTQSGMPSQETDGDGTATLNKAALGDYDSPYGFMKYDELLFILAEAAQRGIIDGGAAAAEEYYYDAVRASVSYWGEVFQGANITPGATENFLLKIPFDGTHENIMNQKFIALFWVGYESWHEYKRTGYPILTIGSATSNDGILPKRFAYPITSMTTNPDNYRTVTDILSSVYRGGDDMKTPVWWSKDAVEAGIQ